MNTPRHATDEQIEEIWDALMALHDPLVEQIVAPNGNMRGLDDWLQLNEREAA